MKFEEVMTGSKRRSSENDSWDSVSVEKKQRVEKLVSGLSKNDRDKINGDVSSTTDKGKLEENNGIRRIPSPSGTSEDSYIDVTTSSDHDTQLISPTTLSNRSTREGECERYSNPNAYHKNEDIGSQFNPRIIQTNGQRQHPHHQPFFPVPREKGIIFHKKAAPSKSNIIRVPRDNKTPFLIYTPPKYAIKGLINKPMANPPKLHPPTLQPISELRRNHVKPQEENHPIAIERVQNEPVVVKKVKRIKSTPTINEVNDLSKWSVEDVNKYLLTTDCSSYSQLFKDQEIDGGALLLLDELSISRLLGVKIGPAMKLYAVIKGLKEK